MVIPIVVDALGTVLKGLEKSLGRTGEQKKNQDDSDLSTVRIGLNTKDLMRLCYSDFREKLPVRSGVKNLPEIEK